MTSTLLRATSELVPIDLRNDRFTRTVPTFVSRRDKGPLRIGLSTSSFYRRKGEGTIMANLKRAHAELFRRTEDERYASLAALHEHCVADRESSKDHWHPPQSFEPQIGEGTVGLQLNGDGAFALNLWSFSQLCSLAGVSKDTLNKLSPDTVGRALRETIPSGNKPLQALTTGEQIRSIHGTQYSRLWNADLLAMLREFAVDFEPPPKGFNGATGLYCGEQDMFCFLIDPAGWTEIGGQNFAPGFFVWNSEVGRRSVGVQTFWFQAVCQNHIVWDAVEVVEFTRKHTGNVAASLGDIRRIISDLVAKRDARKDGFAAAIAKAMSERVAEDGEEASKLLFRHGIPRHLVKQAVARIAQLGQAFTLWSLVDALTQLNGEVRYAGDRTEADSQVAQLLALAV